MAKAYLGYESHKDLYLRGINQLYVIMCSAKATCVFTGIGLVCFIYTKKTFSYSLSGIS